MQFVLAHDALHCGLSHFARREHRDAHRWDIACDHAVNQLLKEDKLEPPEGSLYNDEYAGMAAEEIFPLIPGDSDEQTLDQHLYHGDQRSNSSEGSGDDTGNDTGNKTGNDLTRHSDSDGNSQSNNTGGKNSNNNNAGKKINQTILRSRIQSKATIYPQATQPVHRRHSQSRNVNN